MCVRAEVVCVSCGYMGVCELMVRVYLGVVLVCTVGKPHFTDTRFGLQILVTVVRSSGCCGFLCIFSTCTASVDQLLDRHDGLVVTGYWRRLGADFTATGC